jgi:6-pyruvoyltetrahydropterin/6-carboxytetrahydropterin synthase
MLGTATTGPATADTAGVARDSGASAAHRISIAHTFETAHRLPHLSGKCTNLHGHSWRVVVSATAPSLAGDGTIVEFGALKAGVRQWIDTYLDHGTMLGAHDPLVVPLTTAGCKVFRFGVDAATPSDEAETLAADLTWPTVEAVAVLLHRVSQLVLTALPSAAGATVGPVVVRETHLNTATYGPEDAEAAWLAHLPSEELRPDGPGDER